MPRSKSKFYAFVNELKQDDENNRNKKCECKLCKKKMQMAVRTIKNHYDKDKCPKINFTGNEDKKKMIMAEVDAWNKAENLRINKKQRQRDGVPMERDNVLSRKRNYNQMNIDDDDDEIQDEDDDLDLSNITLTPKDRLHPIKRPRLQNYSSSSNTSQQSILSYRSSFYHIMNKQQQQKASERLVYWLVKSAKPLSMVDDKDFISYNDALNPSFKSMNRKQLGEDWVPWLYKEVKQEVEQIIKSFGAVTMGLDGSSDGNGNPIEHVVVSKGKHHFLMLEVWYLFVYIFSISLLMFC